MLYTWLYGQEMPPPRLEFEQNLDLERLITPWKQPPHKTFVLTNANVIDPLDGRIRAKVTVRLSDGIVASVEETVSGQTASSEDTVTIDLEGKYILPGLWDCHVHLAAVPEGKTFAEMLSISRPTSLLRQPEMARAMLDRGFTTVRDCGGALLPLKQAFDQGIFPGPRLFIAGHLLTQTGGSGDERPQSKDTECCGGATQHASRVVDGVPQCLKFAREELRLGADFIKIMAGGGVSSPTGALGELGYTEDEIRAITSVTSNARTFTTAHAYTPDAIQQAVRYGVLGIEHGNYLDEPTATMMAEKGVYLTPTLVTYAAAGMPEFATFVSEHSRQKLQDTLAQGLEAIKIAEKAGVTMCFGTDLMGPMHFAQTKEFVLRSTVQSPLEIIRGATVNPAKMMGREDSLGRVAPGFVADLLILNANPLDDVTVLDRPNQHLLAVLKEGRVVTSRWSKLNEDSRRPIIVA